MLKNQQDYLKGVTLTENVTSAMQIEKGDISFGAINQNSNVMYLGYRNTNLILVVDINEKKILAKIPLFNPKYIQVNSKTNTVYVVGGNQVSVIDGMTNKKIKELEDAPFARFLAVNQEKNLLYVTCNNAKDKSRKKDPVDKVVIFDGSTLSKIKEIDRGVIEPEGVAIDAQSGNVYVSNSKNSTVTIIDGNSNSISDSFEIKGDRLNWLGSGWQRLDNIVMINPKTEMLYVVGTTGSSGDGGGAELFCLYTVYIPEKKLMHKLTLDGSASEICNSVALNELHQILYIRKPSKNAILVMDGYAKTTIDSVELIKMGFFKKIFSDKSEPIIFNPASNKLYQADGKQGLLLEMDG